MSEKEKSNAKQLSEIFKNLGSTFRNVDSEFAQMMDSISAGIETFNSIKKMLNFDKEISLLKKMLLGVQDALNSVIIGAKKSIKTVKDFGSDIKTNITSCDDVFKQFFNQIKEKGVSSLGEIKSTASSAFSTLKNNPFKALSKSVAGFGTVAAGAFSVSMVGGIALAVAAVAGFAAYFNDLMENNEEFREKVTSMWEGIGEAFKPAIDAFGELFACLVTGKESVDEQSGEIADSFLSVVSSIIEGITGIVSFFSEIAIGVAEFIKEILFTTSEDATGQSQTTWDVITQAVSDAWSLIESIFSTATEIIMTLWALFGEDIISVISTSWEAISSIISGAVSVVRGVFDLIVGIFTGNGEKIKDGFSKIWEGIKKIFGGVGDFFKGIWDRVVSIFRDIGTAVGDAIGGAFKKVVNSVIGFAENTINGFIKAINKAIGLINKIPGVEIKKLELLSIPRLAAGGMVDAGQMFIAREAGPELVGTFGMRTAVMNNNQIVAAVSKGVYDAVRSAAGNGGGNYTFNITNRLDGKEIGRQVIKYHNGIVKQTGMSPLLI